jgi:hypothetical protein
MEGAGNARRHTPIPATKRGECHPPESAHEEGVGVGGARAGAVVGLIA